MSFHRFASCLIFIFLSLSHGYSADSTCIAKQELQTSSQRVEQAIACFKNKMDSMDPNQNIKPLLQEKLAQSSSLVLTTKEKEAFFKSILSSNIYFSSFEHQLELNRNELYDIAYESAQSQGFNLPKHYTYTAEEELQTYSNNIKNGVNVVENINKIKRLLPSLEWELRAQYQGDYSHMPLAGEEAYKSGLMSKEEYLDVMLGDGSLLFNDSGLEIDSFWDLMYTLDPEIFATFVQQNATKLDATFLAKASCFMVKEVLGANSKELEADKSSDDLERAKKATNNINVLMEYFPDKLSRNSIGLEMEKDEQVNQSCDSDQLLEYFQVWLEKTQELHSFDAKSEFKSNSQEIDKSIQRAQEGSNFRFKLNEFMVDRAFFSREVNNKTVEFYLELYRGGVESCPAYYTQNWKKALLESMSSLDFVKLLKKTKANELYEIDIWKGCGLFANICKVEKNIPAYIKQYSLPMIQSKVISLDNNKDFGLIEKVFKENIIHEKEKRFYCPK